MKAYIIQINHFGQSHTLLNSDKNKIKPPSLGSFASSDSYTRKLQTFEKGWLVPYACVNIEYNTNCAHVLDAADCMRL